MADANPAWRVSALNRYVKELIESDYRLQDIWVEGEVANLSLPKSGHIYFSLKDESATLKAVMWKTHAARLPQLPQAGSRVRAHGRLSVYEAGGDYQLYADRIITAGAGDLYLRFEELKARLAAEGLFAPDRKRPLPALPRTIGVVTSPSGAALRDILNVLRRRWPLARVIVFPTLVQGEAAPPEIVRALQAAYQSPLDVLLIARGGGSAEDLACFNEEQVVRTVAQSPIPTVSGIGHEIDFTLTDFAADLRAPTPSAAAEQATPNRADLLLQVQAARAMLADLTLSHLADSRSQLAYLTAQLRLYSPQSRIEALRQRIDDLVLRADRGQQQQLSQRRATLTRQASLLSALNPRAILNRGYAIVTHPDGQVVRHATQTAPGDPVNITLAHGRLHATITHTEEDFPHAD